MPARTPVWIAAAGVGLVMGAGAVWAQDATREARALADSQRPALTTGPVTAPSAAAVPGFQGSSPGLQTFADNPDGLATAGAAAAAGSAAFDLTQGSLGARATADVDPAADWLAAARGAHGDPMSLLQAGGATTVGTETQACREETQTDSHTTHTLYSCETSTTVAVTHPACAETYAPEVTPYQAVCTETWNGSRFDRSEGCVSADDRNCSAGPRVCKTPSTPVHAPYD